MTQWLFPACALMFFALFGFANEARKHYRLAFLWISERFGYNLNATQTSGSNAPRWKGAIRSAGNVSLGSLPVHITPAPPRIKRQSSFDSVLDIKSFDVDRDVEKNAELSLSLPPYPKEEFSGDLSPTTSNYPPSDIEARAVDVDFETLSEAHSSRERCVEHHIVPAYHRPFTPPSVYPDEDRSSSVRSLMSVVGVEVQTHH
ncbi:hypothetical protein K503DRAFT_869871 [Rhizopogon vinicolor AM-OR11-026]|uniref:Uncharacterized protein n=1 Tax=Rhizopogon vinicolor AM-OR11-026 TaxID=1314800 RepID=A0A1B7MK22_9AGAM|nr:hypothetical protein K503DRAFT_869871 [Rhizopogon vinicolor AM-OR11-026]